MVMSKMYQFGPHIIPESQVFYKSKFCLGLVNLKPITEYVALFFSFWAFLSDQIAEDVGDIWKSKSKINIAQVALHIRCTCDLKTGAKAIQRLDSGRGTNK